MPKPRIVDFGGFRVKGKWVYLYRAVDSSGATIDFLVSAKRDAAAAERFLAEALGVGFVHSPTVVGRSEPRAQTSFHFWGIPLDPTPHRDVIGVQTSLGEQLLDVPVRQGKTQIPTNRQKDDFRFELPPLEQTGNR